jgi:mannose-6-phosphate isomerase-like protein (cupin superfamily)
MIETIYSFAKTDQKAIERIIDSDHLALNHIVLPGGEALPEHHASSNVYMVVVRGTLTLRLGEQEERSYPAGSIVAIPYRTRMHPLNRGEEVLEFFVVKAPGPSAIEAMEQARGSCNCED